MQSRWHNTLKAGYLPRQFQRKNPKHSHVDVSRFNGKRMHLTGMNAVLRSKNGLGNHFNEENRQRMGWLGLVSFYQTPSSQQTPQQPCAATRGCEGQNVRPPKYSFHYSVHYWVTDSLIWTGGQDKKRQDFTGAKSGKIVERTAKYATRTLRGVRALE